MAVWPSTLPQQPLLDGYREQFPRTTIRTEMDAGPAKIRRRHTAAPRPVRYPILLTTAQRTTLDTFYTTTIAGGSLPFDWVNAATGVTASFRFRSEPALDGIPDADGLYRLALDLEIMP